MTEFPQHTLDSAPEASRPVLAQTQKALGFVPNLYAVLAESPAALNAYAQIGQTLDQHAALSAVERNIAAIAMSRENSCAYCVAAHSTLAKMAKASEQAIAAARAGTTIDDRRLEGVRRTAAALVQARGLLDEAQVRAFYAAGFERQHLLDLVTVAALKTLSNYTNHLTCTALDGAFASQAWSRD